MPPGPYGLIFHDASRQFGIQRRELERFAAHLAPGGFAFVHDSAIYDNDPAFRVVENCAEFAAEHGLSHMSLRSARGLEILKRGDE